MLGQLCGSVSLSQPRNALSRHSSSHSGSPFFAEMRRMMSSFRPLGAESDSISVTKPYLYSLLTRVSTDELMRSPGTRSEDETSRPTPLNLHCRSAHGTRMRCSRSKCAHGGPLLHPVPP